MSVRAQVKKPRFEKTTDPKRMLTHALLDEALQNHFQKVVHCLPARTSTFIRYESGATKAKARNEGESEVSIDLPLQDGWYLPDGNPFAIPNGRGSTVDDPNALYLVRHQDRDFSGPLGRGYSWCGYYRGRGVGAFGWSFDSGVALVGREATAPMVEVPKEKLASVADPQKLRDDAAQLRQIAETLQERFKGWDQVLVEVVKPMLEKAVRFIEVAEAIEQARN
ncbi:MAG: hypothetical protein ABIJ10_07490 [Candidatus Micrarchaeota archaeon]